MDWLFLLLLVLALVLAGCRPGNLIGWGPGWSATAVSDGVVYVGTRQGEVLALDAKNGEKIWRFAPGEDQLLGGVFGMPAVGEQFIYVGDKGDREGMGGRLYALRKDRESTDSIQTDRGEWDKPMLDGGGIVGGPALAEDDGLVLVGSDDGSLYAFHTTASTSGGTAYLTGDRAWRFSTDKQIWSTPAVGDGVAYFGSMDRNIYALSLKPELEPGESRLLWEYKTGGAVVSKPLLLTGDKMVIVGSFDEKLYALHSETGDFLWSFEGDGWFWAGAVSDGKHIFAPSMAGTVYALDKKGSSVWRSHLEGGSPIVSTPVIARGKVVVATDRGTLHFFRTNSGEEPELHRELRSRVKAPLSSEGNLVFVGVEDSTVRGINVDQWQQVWQVSTKE